MIIETPSPQTRRSATFFPMQTRGVGPQSKSGGEKEDSPWRGVNATCRQSLPPRHPEQNGRDKSKEDNATGSRNPQAIHFKMISRSGRHLQSSWTSWHARFTSSWLLKMDCQINCPTEPRSLEWESRMRAASRGAATGPLVVEGLRGLIHDQLKADLSGAVAADDLHQSGGTPALLPKALAVLAHVSTSSDPLLLANDFPGCHRREHQTTFRLCPEQAPVLGLQIFLGLLAHHRVRVYSIIRGCWAAGSASAACPPGMVEPQPTTIALCCISRPPS